MAKKGSKRSVSRREFFKQTSVGTIGALAVMNMKGVESALALPPPMFTELDSASAQVLANDIILNTTDAAAIHAALVVDGWTPAYGDEQGYTIPVTPNGGGSDVTLQVAVMPFRLDPSSPFTSTAAISASDGGAAVGIAADIAINGPKTKAKIRTFTIYRVEGGVVVRETVKASRLKKDIEALATSLGSYGGTEDSGMSLKYSDAISHLTFGSLVQADFGAVDPRLLTSFRGLLVQSAGIAELVGLRANTNPPGTTKWVIACSCSCSCKGCSSSSCSKTKTPSP